ncbi:MAG: hypothetical protein DRI48_11630 [Chloroflexi bacterium]|nr:MAG: hypothetical protein DRI48_11630 [Chloroflexota bacterium]
MVQESNVNKRLGLFFLLAYAFSWLFWVPQALAAHNVTIPVGVTTFLSGPFNPAAFGPLVAALVLVSLDEGWKGAVGLLKLGKVNLSIIGFTSVLLAIAAAIVLARWGPDRLSRNSG